MCYKSTLPPPWGHMKLLARLRRVRSTGDLAALELAKAFLRCGKQVRKLLERCVHSAAVVAADAQLLLRFLTRTKDIAGSECWVGSKMP